MVKTRRLNTTFKPDGSSGPLEDIDRCINLAPCAATPLRKQEMHERDFRRALRDAEPSLVAVPYENVSFGRLIEPRLCNVV